MNQVAALAAVGPASEIMRARLLEQAQQAEGER